MTRSAPPRVSGARALALAVLTLRAFACVRSSAATVPRPDRATPTRPDERAAAQTDPDARALADRAPAATTPRGVSDAGAPSAAPALPEGTLETALAQLPAGAAPIRLLEAARFGERVVALEPGGLALVAIDLSTRARPWRRTLAPPARFGALHQLNDRRVMYHRGNEVLVLDISDGRVVTHEQGSWTRPDSPAYLNHQGGACALHHTCALQPIDCDTGHALGDGLRGVETHEYPLGGGTYHTTDCLGYEPFVLGRAGDVLLYGDGRGVVGLDAHTGARRFVSAPPNLHPAPQRGERSIDGRSCWVTDSGSALAVLECETGAVRWTAAPLASAADAGTSPYARALAWIDTAPQGLFVLSSAGRALLLDAATGAERWSRALPPHTAALPYNARSEHELMPLVGEDVTALWLLDPATGATRATVPVQGPAVVHPAPDLYARISTTRGEFDATGAPVHPARAPRFALENAGNQVSVREGGRVVLTLAQGFVWSHEFVAGGEARLALFTVVEGSHAELRILGEH